MFLFLYFLPFIGGSGSVKEISSLASTAIVKLNYLSLLLGIVLVVIFSFAISYLIVKFYKYIFYKFRFKKAKVLLSRFYTEIFLFRAIDNFDEKHKLELELSRKETASQLIIFFHRPFVIKKIGLHHSKRILDGLNLIVKEKLKTEDQLILIKNWIELVSVYL